MSRTPALLAVASVLELVLVVASSIARADDLSASQSPELTAMTQMFMQAQQREFDTRVENAKLHATIVKLQSEAKAKADADAKSKGDAGVDAAKPTK